MIEKKTKLITIRVTPTVKQFIKNNNINQTRLFNDALFNDALKRIEQSEKIRVRK